MGSEVSYLEYFKAITPFVLAFIVYLVWHFQKGNEVLANESKTLINQVNEVMQINSNLMSLIRECYSNKNVNLENINILKSNLDDFNLRVGLVFSTFNFLNDAIEDKDLLGKSYEYLYCFRRTYFKYEIEIQKLERGQQFKEEDEEFLLSIHNEIVMNANVFKRIFLKYAMYRNTFIYKNYIKVEKFFKFKKL